MFADLFTPEQLTILTQIILIDLVLAGDNAIIIGMVASKFPIEQRKNYFFWNWWSCNFKNNFNFTYSISLTNNWFAAISRRIAITLYCLQTLY